MLMGEEIRWEPRALTLDRLSWEEFRDYLADGTDLALIPVGSTEQHGPNGSFAVDAGRAEIFARKLAERLYPKAFSVPVFSYGVSPHHLHFPGTLSLRPETFMMLLRDVIDSLYQHGVRKYFIINGHGGNAPALTLTLGELKRDYPDIKAGWASFTALGLDAVRDQVTSRVYGHACEIEMSQAMYLAPWTVKEARSAGAVCASTNKGPGAFPIHWAQGFEEMTENGALGDARNARWDWGRDMVELALDRLTEELENL